MSKPGRVPTVRVEARGESFPVVQLQGNLFVCSRANGNCCCGWEEKGRMPFDNELWSAEWERRRIRNRLHLTFTGCLGPCITGNNALLQLHGRSIWLKDLNRADLVPAVFDYAEAMLEAGEVLAPPPLLEAHVYERFVPPPAQAWAPLAQEAPAEVEALPQLDPVCLMNVDPETATQRVEWEGQVVAFCSPVCKKKFLAEPGAYTLAGSVA